MFAFLRKKKLAVPKADLVSIIESMDADRDGYISLDEVVELAKKWKDELKTARKYWKS